MKRKNLKKLLLIIPIIVLIGIGTIIVFKPKSEIEKVLKTEEYSYLPKAAKNYIEKAYKETGEIILTEKNKEENKPYLNPEYIEYLELSEQEKNNVSLIPDSYTIDFSSNKIYEASTLPKSYDLRNDNGHNFISPIKNQGTTSICWAFASVENIETLYMKNHTQSYSDIIPNFSIRQMDYITSTSYDTQESNGYLAIKGNWTSGLCPNTSCSWTPWENPNNGSHELDHGGNFLSSSIAMSNAITLTDESVMEWHEEKKPVMVNDIYGYDKSLYEVDSTIQLPTINKDTMTANEKNSYVNRIKTYMLQYGGPFVGTLSPESTCGFKNTDGTYAIKTDECYNDSKNSNEAHAMQIIGWDDEYEYSYCDEGTTHSEVSNGTCSKGTLTTGKGAWILRNSWGTSTPKTETYSYVYLSYDSTRLMIGFSTSISDMKNRTWDNNYHANPWIERKISNGVIVTTAQEQEFNTHNTASEKIEKIKFLASSVDGKFTISVHTDKHDYDNIQTVNTTEAGIYTVDLSSKNIILEDPNFSVLIETTNDGYIINDSISVFTSNVSDKPSLETEYISGITRYEDPNGKPSEENIVFMKSSTNMSVKLRHYLKNISDYKKISYNALLNGVNYNKYFFDDYNLIPSKMLYIDGTVETTLNISKEDYSDVDVCGKVYTFQILYDNEVLESFPVKRICNNWNNNNVDYTKSTIRFHKNDGSGYYSTITKNDTTSIQIMKKDGTENAYIGDLSKFFLYDRYIKSWNTKADGTGTSYTNNDFFIYKDTDLYAQWSNPETEPHQYKIIWECSRYICHATDILSKTTTVTFNKDFTVPNNTFTNLTEGQEFIYWAFDQDSNNKDIYYEGEVVQNITENRFYSPYNNEDLVYITAVWSDSYNTITFDANGGEGTMKSIKIINDKTARIKYNSFTNGQREFLGWNTKSDGSGTSYADGGNISLTKDITLYAQWEEEKVSIEANPTSISYGTVNIGFSSHIQKQVTIKNKSNENITLAITNPTGSGPFGSAGFENNKVLTPEEEYEVTLIANYSSPYASVAGTYNGTYVFTATGESGKKATIEVPATITIKEEEVSLEANPTSISFGTANAGFTSNIRKTIKVKNTSNVSVKLTLTNPTGSGPFGSVNFQNEKELQPNEEYNITVIANSNSSFASKPGNYNGTYIIKGTSDRGNSYNLEVPASIVINQAPVAKPNVLYRTHVQDYGWQNFVSNGTMAGTSGKAKRLEAIQIKLENASYSGNVEYHTHVQDYGWMSYVKNGISSGTSGEARRLEAIQIRLTGELAEHYDIYYRVHAENFGWMGWAKNDEMSGTAGYAFRLEGIEIVVVEKGENPPVRSNTTTSVPFKNKNAVQSITLNKTSLTIEAGDTANLTATIAPSTATDKTITWTSSNTSIATVNQSGKVTAKQQGIATITAKSNNGKTATCNVNVLSPIPGVKYTTHVQYLGWQDYVSNGAMAGTSGRSLRLEGIKIELKNMPYEGDIEYRTHVQDHGWMSYKKNGEMSGTSGESRRLEAIQIRLTGEVANHYDVYYRVHAENFGWMNWAKNNEMSGTAGYAFRLEGIEIVIVEKGQNPPARSNTNVSTAFRVKSN